MTPDRWLALGLGIILGAWLGWLGGERSVCDRTCKDLGFSQSYVSDGVCDCPDVGFVTIRH